MLAFERVLGAALAPAAGLIDVAALGAALGATRGTDAAIARNTFAVATPEASQAGPRVIGVVAQAEHRRPDPGGGSAAASGNQRPDAALHQGVARTFPARLQVAEATGGFGADPFPPGAVARSS